MFQARAIADIVQRLGWSYVSLVSSEGLYGDSGSKEFMKQAASRKICIATHEKISPTMEEIAYDSLVVTLQQRNATGVVLFLRAEDTSGLLSAVKRARSRTVQPGVLTSFSWVAADGWGTHAKLIENVEDVAWGAITVELQAKAIPGFDSYMRSLTPWSNLRNPWFSEYWETWFQCQLAPNLVQQQQLASNSYNTQQATSANNNNNNNNYFAAAQHNNQREPFESDNYSIANNSSSSSKSYDDYNIGEDSDSGAKDQRRARRELRAQGNLTAARIPRHAPQMATTFSPNNQQLQQQQQQITNKMRQFCSPNLRINESNGYRQEQKVQFVVDAVYAMAHALDKAWRDLCGAQSGLVCEQLKELNGKLT